jgi:cyclopropane fatty-acyl-phospholipid synthase-like methyltransferase
MTEEVINRVRNYYDSLGKIIVKDVGKTYQAGTLANAQDPYRDTNLYQAERAGIKPGMKVLDAGCGACGPAIDVAQHYPDVQIEAVTLSQVQADLGKEFVAAAGLSDRIHVHTADYHQLAFDDATFDIVYFFESTGYSYDQFLLFSEMFRLLRPGGTLYIKDAFVKEPPLTEQEQKELAEFNRLYAFDTRTISATVSALLRAQFNRLEVSDITQFLSPETFEQAKVELKNGKQTLTDFGKAHQSQMARNFIIFFADIKAYKPGS